MWIIHVWSPVGCDLTLCFSGRQYEPDLMSQEMGWKSRQGAVTSARCRRSYTPHIFTGDSLPRVSVWCHFSYHCNKVWNPIRLCKTPQNRRIFFFFWKDIEWYKASQWIFLLFFPVFFYGRWNSLIGIDELFKRPSWTSYNLVQYDALL